MSDVIYNLFRLLESHEPEGREWDVVVIEAGWSRNRVYYSSEILRKALHLFEGLHVSANEFRPRLFDHLPEDAKRAAPGGFPKQVVGWLEGVRFRTFEREGETREGITARFRITENAKWLRELLRDSWQMGKRDLLGLSIDAHGLVETGKAEGREGRVASSIESVDSVDVVTHPAAGGGLLRLAASLGDYEMTLIEILAAMRETMPKWFDALDIDLDGLDEDKAKGTFSAIVESNLSRATNELASVDQGKEPAAFAEVARGVVMLNRILKALDDNDVDEAKKLIRNWISVYPSPEGDNENRRESLYSFPEAAHKPDDMKRRKAVREAARKVEPAKPPTGTNGGTNGAGGEGVEAEILQLRQQMAGMQARETLDRELRESKLPPLAADRVRQLFEGRTEAPTTEQVREAVVAEKNYLAALSESGQVRGLGSTRDQATARIGEEERDRFQKAMDGMLQSNNVGGVRAFTGLHESFRQVTQFNGSREEMGRQIMRQMAFCLPGQPGDDEAFAEHHAMLRESVAHFPSTLRESLSLGDWAQVFGDSIRRALIKIYTGTSLPDWRRVVSSIVPAQDFRDNPRIRVGGFGDLDIVSEFGTYQELATPGDEEITYSVQKRGNIFSVSFEAITNDDLGAVRQIPQRLGIAAARTISKFVLKTLITDNPVMDYDGVALFNAAHNNIAPGAALVDSNNLQDAIEAMRKQKEFSSNERIGLQPRILMVPADLEGKAYELVQSRVKVTSNENATIANIATKYRIEVLENIWQTDTDDWQLITDPKLNPTIEIGFLGGRQEPELFIQDQPAIGTVLTQDRITYKIRHIYGGDVLDHRGFVAGKLD